MAAKRKKTKPVKRVEAKPVSIGDVVLISTAQGPLPAMVTDVRMDDSRTAYEPDSPPRYVRRIDTVAFCASGTASGTLIYRALGDAEWSAK